MKKCHFRHFGFLRVDRFQFDRSLTTDVSTYSRATFVRGLGSSRLTRLIAGTSLRHHENVTIVTLSARRSHVWVMFCTVLSHSVTFRRRAVRPCLDEKYAPPSVAAEGLDAGRVTGYGKSELLAKLLGSVK